ncbi:flagellar biosynthesis protein FlhB [Uliginosibacterium sediminicola]|uniref:Flagellar biosynthetic protein FlhB n=1 Tax=Uliginosibacterium sediminicola TaxID=2024550 RepID=A0ABU9Z413_9RHOO
MAEDSDLEKTEAASDRRIQQAREEGNVPRSRELSSFLVMLVGILTLWWSSSWFYTRMGGLMQRAFRFDHEMAFNTDTMGQALMSLSVDAMLTTLPLLTVVTVSAAASHMMIGGVVLSSKVFELDLTRLNPVSGFARLFSMNGLVELLKAVLKSAFILGVAGLLMWRYRYDLLGLMAMPLDTGLFTFSRMLALTALALTACLALVAAADVPYQLWHYFHELRMTKEEVKRESKESEGDPQMKGKIRARMAQMARRRMMDAVPKANVVVTNPTHYAVALRYEAGSMSAPTVVAKGADLMAQTIRELAKQHGVPLLESPPLARALFHHAELDQQIPATLYTAVAEVMAYIFQLNQFITQGGLPPQAPGVIDVPPGLDPAAE